MPLFPRNSNSRSNPPQSGAGPQHFIQPQSTYKRFKISVARLFRSYHRNPATHEPPVDTTGFRIGQAVPVGHEQDASVSIANDISREPAMSRPTSTQAEGRNPPLINAEPVITQLQGAQGFTISGNPILTNIGMNAGVHTSNVTTVNNYGGTHGLENLKEFVSFAALHDSAEQDPKRRCHPGTRKNVLSRLRDWFDNPGATERICWLYGPAGAGKSAIAQTIAHEYNERGVAATFFFYRSDAERNNGNRLFPTLAWQLAFSIPAIKDFIVQVLDKTPHLPRKDIETQFERLVAHPFHPTNKIASQLLQPTPVVIIDGLDECYDEELQKRILTVIGNAVKGCRVPLHFLICSRPEALIEEVLDQFKDFTLCIDLAALDDSNHDVEKYLIDQFSVIASKRGLDPTWPGPEIIEEFVFKSSGNFIFAATVMRYISDEDCDPEEQLDIVRNLRPGGNSSPFALLDELYLEILKRQRHQDFVKTFLALFIGRTSISGDLHEDDTMLMNVSEKNLHVKLRKMRSLLKFEPFIDVYHKSFLDFLQDLSRSGQYHVSEQSGRKQYLELIVECVVRHISMAIKRPNDHEECHSNPKFRSIVKGYPPNIVLPVKDWQEALQPLLDFQNRLLNTLEPRPCYYSQAMRQLLLHLAILQGNHHIATAQMLESNMNETATKRSPTLVIEFEQEIPERDLDRCLSVLFSCLPQTSSALTVDTVIIERMSSLLAFDHAKIAARIRSVAEAQKLIDTIDLVIYNQTFLNHCGRDATRKAAFLVSEIYSRVPLLPSSLFLNGSIQQWDWFLKVEVDNLEHDCQRVFSGRILDHNYIVPLLWIYQGDELKFVFDNVNERNESVDKWLERSRPDFIARIRVMLNIGKSIRYIHSMNAVLSPGVIVPAYIALDTDLHAKVAFGGYFAWQVREYLIYDHEESRYLAKYTPENNVAAFAELFQDICFDRDNENHLVEDATTSSLDDAQTNDDKDNESVLEDDIENDHEWMSEVPVLIERCRAEDPNRRPTMEDVVKEMEAWNLT